MFRNRFRLQFHVLIISLIASMKPILQVILTNRGSTRIVEQLGKNTIWRKNIHKKHKTVEIKVNLISTSKEYKKNYGQLRTKIQK